MGDMGLPREIAAGVHWLGGCIKATILGVVHHTHVSVFLVVGSDKTALIDTGHPHNWDEVESALDQLLGDRPLDYVLPTHQEFPHAGNFGRLATKYPESIFCGNMYDYHLAYPGLRDRMCSYEVGESIDLGNRQVTFEEAIIRDLPTTLWMFDDLTKTLFVSDGYAYQHEHTSGQCALTAEELPAPPTAEQGRFITRGSLYWTRFVEMDPILAHMHVRQEELDARVIAPAHGNVITEPERMLKVLDDVLFEKQA